MNNPIRTALIGYGKAAHMHAQALKNIPENILVAVQGRDLNKARLFGDQYKLNAYDDLETMIASERLDMIVICTPHPYHRHPAVTALSLGVHVLIEKPIASSLSD